MFHRKMKTLSVVCNPSNKQSDGKYVIPMSALSSESVIGASVKSVVFRNLFYNVVGSGPLKNNVFHFTLDETPEEVIIPEGFYTIAQLLPIVQAGIQTLMDFRAPVVQTVLMTYSLITLKVTIKVTDNGNLDIFGLSGGSFVDSINALLGNTVDVVLDTLFAVPYEMDQMMDLSGEDASQLVIEELSQSSGMYNSPTDQSGSTNGLMTLLSYRGAGFGELCDWQNPDPIGTMLLYDLAQDISNLNIYLQTASGATLDNQGADIHVELLLHLQ